MKLVLLLLISLGLASCERSKDSLAGSYKLDKPVEQKMLDKTYYNLGGQINDQRNAYDFKVETYAEDSSVVKEVVKQGSLTISALTKNEKHFFQFHFMDKAKNEEILLAKSLNPATKEIKSFEFADEGILFFGAYNCQDENCETIRFSIKALRQGDQVRAFFKGFAFYWLLKQENEFFKFKSLCQFSNRDSGQKLFSEPYYLLQIPADSPEVQCFNF